MKITFNIEYKTTFGEELQLNLLPQNKGGQETAVRMTTDDGKHWTCTLSADDDRWQERMEYFYSVLGGQRQQRREWQLLTHRLELTTTQAERLTLNDRWQEMPHDSYLYSSAFTDCVNRRAKKQLPATNYDTTLRLIVRAPQLRMGERLAVVGDEKALGAWLPRLALPMTEHNYNEWTVDIDASKLKGDTVELKFIAINDKGEVQWETCANRQLVVPPMQKGDLCRVEFDQAFFAICDTKLAGTLIPLFSLRSESSFGVGDFGDLRKMIDWVADTHQRVLQLLPINDTTATRTWVDSYPYRCISIFALHPQYADLTQLPSLKDKQKAAEMEQLRVELNALPQIDYERVNNAKTEYLRLVFKQEGSKVLQGDDFRQFFHDNEHWLVPYARYCTLRDEYGTADFSQWPAHREWQEAERKSLTNPRGKLYRLAAFYYYVQFVLSQQMRAAHEYAVARGVILKGDIPIGVDRNGCDVWHEPQYFHLDSQAGAPPDAFSVNGQNWGFPTYNWPRMIDDGCQWWIRRFQNMANYFDAYRIDHVLGFFRIWDIPADSVHALTGQFSPSLAMTVEEIESYGLKFQEDFFTQPFIADWILERVFGENAQMVKDKFLDCLHDDIYALKPEFNTQRKIEAWFESEERKVKNEKSKSSSKPSDSSLITLHSSLSNIRDGLYALESNVLFVRDRSDLSKFHPRITAQLGFTYAVLPDREKQSFNRLYDDYYYKRNNYFWYRESMKKLPLLVQATRMLVCAEDLGMVPDCVAWTMEQLRILSLELQSMPKDPSVRFGHLSRNPYRSVCTLSTHDMPTLRQWWDEDEERTQDYYSSMLYRGGAAPHPLPGWLAHDIVARQLASPSMLCILSLQDWLAIDERLRLPDANAERINIPANPRHYWRYRMHLTIEQLRADRAYNDSVKELIDQSGRKVKN